MEKELFDVPPAPIAYPSPLHIYLLGPIRIERDDVPIHLSRRKVESLLAFLILHPERHTRDYLATLFWGDSMDAQARHSLRTALATVRQELAPDLLLIGREHVQLNPEFELWTDLHEVLALEQLPDDATYAEIQPKLARWQGELLAGLYDDWLMNAREYYQARLVKLGLQLVQALRARSDYAAAIAVGQRVLSFEPANELAHQHLMFCYLSAGDRPAALRQYEQCVRALEEDVDAPPSPETTALYEWIRQRSGDVTSVAAKITNLPIPLTSFVGRTRETAEIKRLLAPTPKRRPAKTHMHDQPEITSARLLTLLGAGGNGKTRLSIQVATDLIDSFAHGVWWVELGALSDDALVGRAVAKTLGVRETGDEALSETIAHFIGDKQMLLVIDNCEHLVAPTAQMAAALLAQCPDLHILTTSRESLNIVGETLWHVPTFAAPDPTQLGMVELLLQYESVRLFVERAAAVQPGFTLTLENAQAVAEICQRLDGIPLAIELAAARMKVLTVGQIARYLSSALGARFTLLTQGSRVVQPRHQTLRATIDWSYNLLDEAERTLFRQVATFRGGFTLDLLTEVVGDGQTDPQLQATTLDLLTQLVDKSLVMVDRQGAESRYSLLETLREYALAQASADEIAHLQAQHAATFLRFAEIAAPEVIGAQQQQWLNRLEIEHANLRAALDYLLNADVAPLDAGLLNTGLMNAGLMNAGEGALRLATALHRFWEVRGYVSEGRGWLKAALAKRDKAAGETIAQGIPGGIAQEVAEAWDALAAHAMNAAGRLAFRQGALEEARGLHQAALAIFERAEDERGVAASTQLLGNVEMDFGEYASSQRRMEQALAIYRTLNDQLGIASSLSRLGGLAWDQDRFADSARYRRESLQIYRALNIPLSCAYESLGVGDSERMLRNYAEAQRHYEESQAIAREFGHTGLVAATYKSMGLLAMRQDQYELAQQYCEEALRIFRGLGDKIHTAFAVCSLGDVARRRGNYAVALAHYIEYLQIMHEVGYKWPTFAALEDIAHLLILAEQHAERAARLMGAAEALRQAIGLDVAPEFQERYDRVVTTLRATFGDEGMAALWQAGAATPLAEIVTEAAALTLS